MPTILYKNGWRLFFYSNEGNEPIHIHAQNAEVECKYWLIESSLEIICDFSYNLDYPKKREIEEIIYQNFDLIVQKWKTHFKSYK